MGVCLFRRVQCRGTIEHLWITQRTALWRTRPRRDPWNVLASGTTNYASCVTAMGVPTDAAFTLQVPWAGEMSLTGYPLDTGRARLQTCPEASLYGTLVHHSEHARWPVLGSVVIKLAWLATSGREGSTFLLGGASTYSGLVQIPSLPDQYRRQPYICVDNDYLNPRCR